MKRVLSLAVLLLMATGAFGQGVSGSITASSALCQPSNCVLLAIPQGAQPVTAAVGVQVTGSFVATLQAEATTDGATWVSMTGYPVTAGVGVTAMTTPGLWQFNVAGVVAVRIRGSAYASGTAVVTMQPSNGVPTTLATGTTGISGTTASGATANAFVGVDGAQLVRIQPSPTAVLKLSCNAIRTKNCK